MLVARGLGTVRALLVTGGLGLDVVGAGSVLRALPISWRLLSTAQREATSQWHLATSTQRDAAAEWSLLASTSNAVQLDWSKIGLAERELAFRWNMGLLLGGPPHLTLRVANEIRRMLVVK